MILNELREDVSEAREAIYTIGKTSSEYYQLKVFKCAMGGIVFLVQAMVLGVLAFLFLLMASIGAALVIGASLGSSGQGFLVVGGAYLLVFLLAYLGRRRLERPLLKRFSAYYFDEL
jgi:hypothetical protein